MGMNDIGMMRTLSSMVSRSGLASLFGQRFQGKRDYYAVFGYQNVLTYQLMLSKYLRQGLASRIVDAPAQALWDAPPTVTSNNDEWNAAWDDLVVKHDLWQAFLRVDKLAGLGQYSCLLTGVKGSGNTKDPIRKNNTNELRKVLYLQAYSQESAKINEINADPQSSQYMLPDRYQIQPFQQMQEAGFASTPIKSIPAFSVHHSRMVHVAENTLENMVFGSPRLERVFNDLDDMLKVSGGTAETVWLTSNRGMQIDIDKDMELTPEDAKNLSDEMDEFQHQLRRYIRTRGTKVTNLGSDVPNSEPTFNMLISLISGATGIPRRILIGAEAGQLASEQDRANWAERVKFRRAEFGEPIVLFPFIRQMTQMGVLPNSEGLTVEVTWPDAFELTPLEDAQKSAQHARSATNFAAAIEKLEKLKQGETGTPAQIDASGVEIPGTAVEGREGVDYTDIINPDWIRERLGQEKPKPQLDDPGDLEDD